MLMTRSKIGLLGYQVDITLKWKSRQFSNLAETSSISTSSASWGSDQNWMSYADDKVKYRFFQQLRGYTSKTKLMIWSGQDLNSSEIPSMSTLTLVLLNKLRCNAHFWFSKNPIAWSELLLKIHIINGKQCRSRSVGFFRSQLIWIYTVCKGRVYPGSAWQGLTASFRTIWSKLNELCWWQSNRGFIQQSRGVTLR